MEPVKQHEKSLACVMHLASIPFPWLAPIIGILVSGEMPFVKHHSWRALRGQIISVLIIGTVTAISLGFSIYNLYQQYQEGFKDFDIWAVVIKSVVVWAGLFLFGLWNTVASIIEAMRALKGDWIKKREIAANQNVRP